MTILCVKKPRMGCLPCSELTAMPDNQGPYGPRSPFDFSLNYAVIFGTVACTFRSR